MKHEESIHADADMQMHIWQMQTTARTQMIAWMTRKASRLLEVSLGDHNPHVLAEFVLFYEAPVVGVPLLEQRFWIFQKTLGLWDAQVG